MEDFKELIRLKNSYLKEKQFNIKGEIYKAYQKVHNRLDIRAAKETFTYKDYEVITAWEVYYNGKKVGYMLDYFTKAKKIRSVGVEI